MFIQPYVYFDGRCDEALKFYATALGAETTVLMRFKDNPDLQDGEGCAPGMENVSGEKVMHANVKIRDTQIMMSDGMCGGTPKFEGISLTLNAKDPADAEKLFAALVEGGKVQMPLTETFFAKKFGMVFDKFGVSWLIIAEKPMPTAG